jgi:phage-related protein
LPATEVYLYRDESGHIPLKDWLRNLPSKARAKCLNRLDQLSELGSEIRRPAADYLKDGIYELRASYQGLHYRMLYFFSGKDIVVLSHGITKESRVPPTEIEIAVKRKGEVRKDFPRFTTEPGRFL